MQEPPLVAQHVPKPNTGSARVLTSIENMRVIDEKRKKKEEEFAEKEKRKKEREERKAMKKGIY